MINRVVLVGRLTRDPELRRTPNGAAVTSFTLAIDNWYTKDQKASFINVVVWNVAAENVVKYLRKGSLAGVDGRLDQRTYESNGQKINVVEVVADSVQFLEPKSQTGGDSGYQSDSTPVTPNVGVDVADDDLPF